MTWTSTRVPAGPYLGKVREKERKKERDVRGRRLERENDKKMFDERARKSDVRRRWATGISVRRSVVSFAQRNKLTGSHACPYLVALLIMHIRLSTNHCRSLATYKHTDVGIGCNVITPLDPNNSPDIDTDTDPDTPPDCNPDTFVPNPDPPEPNGRIEVGVDMVGVDAPDLSNGKVVVVVVVVCVVVVISTQSQANDKASNREKGEMVGTNARFREDLTKS